jgi:pyruvate kinase
MRLPEHKTKIVATIGPASNSPEILESLIRAGMNIARLNFSHGNFEQHAEVIKHIRKAQRPPVGASRSWPTCRARR